MIIMGKIKEFVEEASDGGYVIVGGGQIKSGKRAGTLFKLDSSGNMQWNKNYTLTINSLLLTRDGGFALAGNTDEGFTLLVTDSNGDTTWNRTYAGGDFSAMVHTDDGGYAMASNIEKGYADVSPWSINDVMLIKTDSFGEIQWDRIYEFSKNYIVNSLAVFFIRYLIGNVKFFEGLGVDRPPHKVFCS